jgi:hypothetical protein
VTQLILITHIYMFADFPVLVQIPP